MATFFHRRGRPPHPDILTPSEWRVLELLREGKTNAEIAYELAISVPGVKYHITNMLGKLHLEDRAGLAAWQPEPDRGTSSRRRWVHGLVALKAPALVTSSVVAVGVTVAGTLVAVSTLAAVPGNDSTPQAAASPTPVPIVEVDAHLIAADQFETRVALTIEWQITPPDAAVLEVHSLLRVTTNAGSELEVNSSNGGPDSHDPRLWRFNLSLAPVPASSSTLTVEIPRLGFRHPANGAPPTPAAIDGPWSIDIPVVFEPRTDLTATVEPFIDSGFGWGIAVEHVSTTADEVTVAYRTVGITPKTHFSAGVFSTLPGASELVPTTDEGGPSVVRVPIPADATSVTLPVGDLIRTETERITLIFPLADPDSWPTAIQLGDAAYPIELRLPTAPGLPLAVAITSEHWVADTGVTGITASLVDSNGRIFLNGTTARHSSETVREFIGEFDPAANSLIFTLTGYGVVERPTAILTIPLH